MVRAWLEVGVERPTARGVARFAKRVDFGVRLTRRVVIALADDGPVPHDDRSHERVRAGPARGARGETQRPAHVGAVGIGHGC